MLGFCVVLSYLFVSGNGGVRSSSPALDAGERRFESCLPDFRDVEESGRPRRFRIPEHAGSNPAIPTKYYFCSAGLVLPFAKKYHFTCGSSNGRTAGFEPADGGSNPPPRATTRCRWTNWSGRLSVKEEMYGFESRPAPFLLDT